MFTRFLQWLKSLFFGAAASKPAPPPPPPPPLVPAPPPPTVPIAPSYPGLDRLALDAEVEHNRQRTQVAIAPLAHSDLLTLAAQSHASWSALNRNLDHVEKPNTPGFTAADVGSRIRLTGYWPMAAGENSAAGQTSVSQVMAAWLQSPGHKANLFNTAYREFGIGLARDAAGILYWCVVFAAPFGRSAPLEVRDLAATFQASSPPAVVFTGESGILD